MQRTRTWSVVDSREYGGLVLGFEWLVEYTEDWYCVYRGVE